MTFEYVVYKMAAILGILVREVSSLYTIKSNRLMNTLWHLNAFRITGPLKQTFDAFFLNWTCWRTRGRAAGDYRCHDSNVTSINIVAHTLVAVLEQANCNQEIGSL